MQYQISGKQINIGDALQTQVKTVLGDVASKYAERPTDANVIFSKSGNEYVCGARYRGEVLGTRVAYGHGRVSTGLFLNEQHGKRFADYVASADDDHMLSLDRDVIVH